MDETSIANSSGVLATGIRPHAVRLSDATTAISNRVARSVLRDDNEAEDVVQQTYLTTFSKIADFRGTQT